MDFFIKLFMLNQKKETVSAVSLFWNHLSADRENLVAGFPLPLSSRARGCAPYHPRFIEIVAVPRSICGIYAGYCGTCLLRAFARSSTYVRYFVLDFNFSVIS